MTSRWQLGTLTWFKANTEFPHRSYGDFFLTSLHKDLTSRYKVIKIRHLTFQKYTTVLFQRKHGDLLKKLHLFYLQLYRISMINIIFTFLSSQLDILLPLFRNLMRIDRFSIYQVILKLRAFLEITAFLLISTLTSVRLNLVKKWLYFKEALLILNNRSMLAILSMEDINGVQRMVLSISTPEYWTCHFNLQLFWENG